MPNIKSNLKSLRKDQERHKRNVSFRSRIKNTRKALIQSVGDKSLPLQKVEEKLSLLYKLCDRGASRGYIKQNKSNRIKSQAKNLLTNQQSETKSIKEEDSKK